MCPMYTISVFANSRIALQEFEDTKGVIRIKQLYVTQSPPQQHKLL
jgi:hypothetical protein